MATSLTPRVAAVLEEKTPTSRPAISSAGAVAHGGDAPVVHHAAVLHEADDRLRVADVDGEQHRVTPCPYRCPPSGRRSSGAHRDDVHAGGGEIAHVCRVTPPETSTTAPAADELDRRAHLSEGHVVQHDDRDATVERLLDLGERLDLHLDEVRVAQPRPHALARRP